MGHREEQIAKAISFLKERPGSSTAEVGNYLWPRSGGRTGFAACNASTVLFGAARHGLVRFERPDARSATFWYACNG